LAAGEALTTTAGHAGEISTIADNVDELRKAIRQRVVRKADFIKIMVTGGATDRYSNRRRAQYTTDELTEAIEDAHRLRRRVVGHANATEGIRRAVLAGIDVIAHCNWLGESPGTIDIDMEIVERMAIQGVQVDLNIEGACRPLSSPDGYPINWPTDRPEPTCRWELLQPLRDAGIPVYLSSDAYGSAIGAFPADVGNAAIQWNMAIETVLQYVTSIPADALGLDRRGRLVAGNVADIAVFAGDLRTDASLLSRQPQTYIRGKLVSRNGWLRPPTAALAHSEEASRHLTYMAAAHRQLD
jgi:imidazolonepropionase-like amidohydrolase